MSSQGMTNNVRLHTMFGDIITQVGLHLVLSKTNVIGGIKYNIFSVVQRRSPLNEDGCSRGLSTRLLSIPQDPSVCGDYLTY
jgi:hypothetical protein